MSSVYSIDIKEDGGKKVLKFGGDLVINHADKMCAELKEALATPSDVSIEIANPENIDMTFIQLVVSIRRTCEASGKRCEIKADLKDDLKTLVCKSGFDRELNIAK